MKKLSYAVFIATGMHPSGMGASASLYSIKYIYPIITGSVSVSSVPSVTAY
ncbi:MAG: hypothetical protein IKH13_04380 [Clostridia bacterium]|nr:hypothetical protein [Clostridia bacterium]